MKALVLVLLVACGSKASGPTEPPGQPPPRATEPTDKSAERRTRSSAEGDAKVDDNCTTPEDCELVDACCGCNAGGHKIAMRKDAVAGFEASRAERCGGQMCAQHISTDPSCDAEPICGSGNRCRVAPHMSH